MAIGIIPARYGSTRLPGKPLAVIAEKTLIIHVLDAAQRAEKLAHVYVATDDERIFDAVKKYDGNVLMTSSHHTTGTDRIVEALAHVCEPDDGIVVNIQGDEPLIDPDAIDACVTALQTTKEAAWSTPIYPLKDAAQCASPQRVKVVYDIHGFALYFSRAKIPFSRDDENDGCTDYYGHIGLYAYRIPALKKFAKTAQTPLEKTEKLEQLRALETGMRIKCVVVPHAWRGIDTPEDLEYIEKQCLHLFQTTAE